MEYPKTEQKLKERVDELNNKWHSACPDDFVSYGFYPYYTQQRYNPHFSHKISKTDHFLRFYVRNVGLASWRQLFFFRIMGNILGIVFLNHERYKKKRKMFQNFLANVD